MKHLLNVSFIKHLIMHLFAPLVVPAGRIFDHSTKENLLFAQNGVFFLVMAQCTKVSNV
jgi:hypothetical protein